MSINNCTENHHQKIPGSLWYETIASLTFRLTVWRSYLASQ